MNIDEYKSKVLDLEAKYNIALHKLNQSYVEENAEFKKGDFIYNVTGIIKVEKISYDIMFGVPEVIYYGYRYKKHKGEILRTKDKKLSKLRSNIKKINV
jgi:hypothetical protein